jgi:hypothetical protein
MMKFLLGFSFLLASAVGAADADWELVETKSSGSKTYLYSRDIIMAPMMERTRVKVWMKIDARNDRSIQWREFKAQLWINCEAWTSGFLYAQFEMPDGALIQKQFPSGPIVPDSVGEIIAGRVCDAVVERRAR